jgi:hypothetical protein
MQSAEHGNENDWLRFVGEIRFVRGNREALQLAIGFVLQWRLKWVRFVEALQLAIGFVSRSVWGRSGMRFWVPRVLRTRAG